MDDDKKNDIWVSGAGEPTPPASDTTGRARNRTVMLSPEVTGQMRNRLGADTPAGLLPFNAAEPEPSTKVREDASRASFEVRAMGSDVARPERVTSAFDDEWPAAEQARFEPQSEPDLKPIFGSESQPETNEQPRKPLENDWYQSRPEEPHQDPRPSAASGSVIRGTPIVMRSASVDAASISGPLGTPEPTFSVAPVEKRPEPRHEGASSMEHEAESPVVVRHSREERPLSRAAVSEPMPVEKVRQAPVPKGDGPEEVHWKQLTPLVGFLVTFDHDPLGSYVELRSGRLIVTSEGEANGNCLLIRDASVSPMHAIMRVSPGSAIQILDQLSENGTRIRRVGTDEEELISGEKSILNHGDVVMFGERTYHVCLLIPEGTA